MFALAWSPTPIAWAIGALVLMYLLLLASRALQVPAARRETKELEQAEDEPAADYQGATAVTSAPRPPAR